MKENVSGALRDFSVRLHEGLSENLLGLILFGSQARGDANALSDVDVVVIVKRRTSKVWDLVTDTAADVSLLHDVTISPLIVSEARWKSMKAKKLLLTQSIESEGISLWNAK